MMNTREEFEKFAINNTNYLKPGDFAKDEDGNYLDIDTVYRYGGWQLCWQYRDELENACESKQACQALNDKRIADIEEKLRVAKEALSEIIENDDSAYYVCEKIATEALKTIEG